MIRVLLAGLGPEPETEGEGGGRVSAAAVARALRNAGFEVVLAGWGHAVEHVLGSALQEDVDAVGLLQATVADRAELVARLAEQGAADIGVLALTPEAAAESDLDGVLPASADADAVPRWVFEHVGPAS
ncbi:hypothetical protein [Rhodococcus sp. X156]|uniref:hypothetical protein n=1 Tax=Rhodococcus sp. X156 TaxID=2499145 RepID=UPI000FDADC06|nr:hypothetical protein [Rhodococcus sp. X156]